MKAEAKSYNLTIKIMIGLALTVSVATLLAGWLYLSQKGLSLAKARIEAEYLEKEAKALNDLEIKYAKVSESADMALDSLPKSKDVSSFIADVETKANNNGLGLTSVIIGGGKAVAKVTEPEFSQTTKKEGYYELPLKLTFEGSYNSFTNLLSEISQLRRLNSIRDIEITNSTTRGGATDGVKATLNMVIYIKK